MYMFLILSLSFDDFNGHDLSSIESASKSLSQVCVVDKGPPSTALCFIELIAADNCIRDSTHKVFTENSRRNALSTSYSLMRSINLLKVSLWWNKLATVNISYQSAPFRFENLYLPVLDCFCTISELSSPSNHWYFYYYHWLTNSGKSIFPQHMLSSINQRHVYLCIIESAKTDQD
jgi:hypothetical protein